MPLLLKGKSKSRLEVQWNGPTPVNISIISRDNQNIVLYQKHLNQAGRLNLELPQLDFSKLPDATEIELQALAEGEQGVSEITSETLTIQKCHHPKCGNWGHAREDGYCKHCGRRIREQTYTHGFPKLEISDFKVILWNGIEGHLWKKKESKEYHSGIYSLGRYQDKYRPRSSVEIQEERFEPSVAERYIKLVEVLKNSGLLAKHWIPPLACFQQENQRTIWIYYPARSSQAQWQKISALTYILTRDADLLSTKDIIKIGIQLCEIVKKIHQQGLIWGGLKLEDLVLCRDKDRHISIYLSSKEISWDRYPTPSLLQGCLVPWELFWETPLELNQIEVTEIYIISALLYFLKAKAPNLLSYNSYAYNNSLPTLKLFASPVSERQQQRDPGIDYFESVVNQGLLLHPQERGYRSIQELQLALQSLLESLRSPALKANFILDVGASKDIGAEKCESDLSKNQDALFVSSYSLKKQKWGLFVLCDGISTATVGSGDIASSLVIDTFREWWTTTREKERKNICRYAGSNYKRACQFLNEMINKANQSIHEYVEKIADRRTLEESLVMGSTITLGLIHEDLMVYGWLGDSPIYRISNFGWERLNYEDNERNSRIVGGMPLEECFIEGGNALTRCVGAHFYVEKELEMNFGCTYLYPGEHILICSDGIPDYIEQEAAYAHHEIYQMLRISSIVQQYNKDELVNTKALAGILISSVNQVGGGYDNLSAILISALSEDDQAYEKAYRRLRSLSPTVKKLLQEPTSDWPI